jgi:hypothetical protein
MDRDASTDIAAVHARRRRAAYVREDYLLLLPMLCT